MLLEPKTRATNYTPSFTLIQRDGVPGLLYGESRKRSLCRTLQMAFNVISPSLWFLKETHSVIRCMIPCMVPFLGSPYLPLLRWFFWHGAPISLNSSLLEVRECILFSLLQPSTVVKLKRDLIQLVWFPIKSPPKVKCIWVSGREEEVLGAVWFWRITQCLLKGSSAVLCISTISFCHLRLHSLYGTVPFGYRYFKPLLYKDVNNVLGITKETPAIFLTLLGATWCLGINWMESGRRELEWPSQSMQIQMSESVPATHGNLYDD